MSCCIGIKTDNELFIAVDGRTSISYMGVKYRVTEDDKKYTIHQNKLVVVFGNSDAVDLFIHECEKNEEKDINTILSIAIPKERIEEYQNKAKNECLLISIYELNIKDNEIACFYIDENGKGNFKAPIYDYFNFGFKQDEVYNYLSQLMQTGQKKAVFDIFDDVFKKINSAEIGGMWTIIKVTQEKIEEIAKYESITIGIPCASEWLVAKIKEDVEQNIIKYRNSQIISPTIKGNCVLAGNVVGGAFWDDSMIAKLQLSSDDNRFADMTYKKDNGNELFKIYDAIDYVSLRLNGTTIGHVGVNKAFNADGTWDFSEADVKGITATFA